MSANTVPIFQRSLPSQGVQTAGGGFTLPQHAFIPGAGTTPLGMSGTIPSPTNGMAVPNHAVQGLQTVSSPLPGASASRMHGIRLQKAGSN